MTRDVRQLVADRLSVLMKASPQLNTLKKLADKSHVPYSTIQRIKKAEVAATITSLDAIAGAFGLTAADLLRDTPKMKKSAADAELWDQVAWLMEHADEEVRTMFRLLVGAMHIKKREEASTKKLVA